MPKRSNDFQKLIYLIHHQLVNEAIVTESKFLHDRAANIKREVDIVIETFVSDYPLTISIECQGRGRVANVEWVGRSIYCVVCEMGYPPSSMFCRLQASR